MVVARQFLHNTYGNRADARDRMRNFTEAINDWDRSIDLGTEQDRPVQRSSCHIPGPRWTPGGGYRRRHRADEVPHLELEPMVRLCSHLRAGKRQDRRKTAGLRRPGDGVTAKGRERRLERHRADGPRHGSRPHSRPAGLQEADRRGGPEISRQTPATIIIARTNLNVIARLSPTLMVLCLPSI